MSRNCANSGQRRNLLFIFGGHSGLMPRPLHAVLLTLLLTACGEVGTLVAVAANVGVVPVAGRTLPDLIYSARTGRDCSMVRVEQGKSWCREPEPPAAPPFCTRSLGTPDCWPSEAAQPMPARAGIAAGANRLTDAQERYRTRNWP